VDAIGQRNFHLSGFDVNGLRSIIHDPQIFFLLEAHHVPFGVLIGIALERSIRDDP
jgi:hypothetical protein